MADGPSDAQMVEHLNEQVQTLLRENELLRHHAYFTALWCYRNGKISDGERLSAIKYHPTTKSAAVEAGLIEQETKDCGK